MPRVGSQSLARQANGSQVSHATGDDWYKQEHIQNLLQDDNFMMFVYKIEMCSLRERHPWEKCLKAHVTENARRRDPREYSYRCVMCKSYREQKFCALGDQCGYAHNVFEANLHPDMYRTLKCDKGEKCDRAVCFFYHTEEQRREPTGLADLRAQVEAGLGPAAISLDSFQRRTLANDIIQSNGSLSTLLPVGATQSLGRTLSRMPSAVATLQSRPTVGSLSGTLTSGSLYTDAHLATETVAPCLQGANRNRALVGKIAQSVNLKPDELRSELRLAALQGRLTGHPPAPAGHAFSDTTEALLAELSENEELDLAELRGWMHAIVTAAEVPKKVASATYNLEPAAPMEAGLSISAYYPAAASAILSEGGPARGRSGVGSQAASMKQPLPTIGSGDVGAELAGLRVSGGGGRASGAWRVNGGSNSGKAPLPSGASAAGSWRRGGAASANGGAWRAGSGL